MSFSPADLEELQRATGMDELEIIGNTALEDEYMKWQHMYHRTGGQGPLSQVMLICLLRMLGIEAKSPVKVESRFDWSQAQLGMRVLVSAKHGHFLGSFVGMIEMGILGVRIGDDPYIREFTREFVSPAPQSLPAGTQLEWKDPEDGSIPEAAAVYAKQAKAKAREANLRESGGDTDEPLDRQQPEVIGDVDSADPTGKGGPHNRTAMLLLNTGDPVLWEHDGDYLDAQFLREGPKDGKVTIYYDSKEHIVDDVLVNPVVSTEE